MQSIWAWGGGIVTTLVSVAIGLATIAVLIRALTRPHRAAAARVAWVAVLLFLPVLGIIAYLFLGETNIGAARRKRMREAEENLPRPDAGPAPTTATDLASVFALTSSINGFPATAGNTVQMQKDSNGSIASLVADIDAATQTVHISFYIWLDDHNGTLVAEAVQRAARRGVLCRIMVDALGSRAFLKSSLWTDMKNAGAHCVAALGDVPRLGAFAIGRPDLRNHRKIVVIDDTLAYCGSQNCADPEFRVKPKFAPWVDVFFRCTGPIVAQQQWLFLTTWATEAPADDAPFTGRSAADPATAAEATSVPAGGVVGAMFGTGPTVRAGAMSEAFVSCIAAAQHELTISTPYFVPDEPLLAALCAAPRRGVRTTLVLPARNDSWFVAQAARSAYDRLLEAGVELYEYPLGLLHSKTLTADGRLSLIGSANMDRRSLELNYENNLVAADPDLTRAVRERQQVYLDASQAVDPAVVRDWSLWKRLVQNAVAMLAPIL